MAAVIIYFLELLARAENYRFVVILVEYTYMSDRSILIRAIVFLLLTFHFINGLAASKSDPSSSEPQSLNGQDWIKSQLTNEADQKINDFLGQFGTARANFNTGDHFDGSALDLLLPLYDRPDSLLYSQWGWRRQNSRNTLNWGLGWRYQPGNGWLFGGNVFLDDDITGDNRRAGLGLELWRDYLKLSVNGYAGTTDWHTSDLHADYDEKPANGFDIRMAAFLPDYPQLGGVLKYEKYYGKDVALFDDDTLQNNPYAVTAGVTYTPIPLLDLALEQKKGSGQQHDTHVEMNITWRPGVSLNSQLDPQEVSTTRALDVSRYDVADRNYQVVLQYKKKQLIRVSLPAHLQGYGGDTTRVNATVTSRHPVTAIDWDMHQLTAAGGNWRLLTMDSVEITFPPYQSGGNNLFEIGAIARDDQGNASPEAWSTGEVLYSDDDDKPTRTGTLTVVSDNAKADGLSYNRVQASITDDSGTPLKGETITFQASNGAQITPQSGQTDADGLLSATLTSTQPGESEVIANLKQGGSRSVMTHFVGDAPPVETLTVISDNARANGSASNSVQVRVTDDSGTPLKGENITFQATNGAQITPQSGQTDADGLLSATLTSTQPGESEVTASLDGGESQQVVTHFLGDTLLTLKVIKDNAVGDNIETDEVEAWVTDTQGQPAPGIPVTFSALSGFAEVDTPQATTDAQGRATTTIRSKVTHNTVTVQASTDDNKTDTTEVHFYPMSYRSEIERNNAPADGKSEDVFAVTLTRYDGSPAAGKTVNFESRFPGMTLSRSSGLTDSQGVARVSATAIRPGRYLLITEAPGAATWQTPLIFTAPR
jgi:adhesin/invasin